MLYFLFRIQYLRSYKIQNPQSLIVPSFSGHLFLCKVCSDRYRRTAFGSGKCPTCREPSNVVELDLVQRKISLEEAPAANLTTPRAIYAETKRLQLAKLEFFLFLRYQVSL